LKSDRCPHLTTPKMYKSLSASRKASSSGLGSGSDGATPVDKELDQYWKRGGSSKKKMRKQQQQQQSQGQSNNSMKRKKSSLPAGRVNLGYGVIDESSSLVLSQRRVTGECTELEKDYLRLTSQADPARVRTPTVLRAALDMVKRKWIQSQDYEYCCNQLKSIRQDLTVQHIRDPFVVEVYETHARIALESDDLQEFAQCQTQLQLLYKEGHSHGLERECEFASYKILYQCLMTGPSDSGLVSFINSLSPNHSQHSAVHHALAVRSSLLTTNYHRFFALYAAAPNMSGYLMDPLALSMRERSVRIVISAYRPRIRLTQMAHILGFVAMSDENPPAAASASSASSSSAVPPSALRECRDFLESKFGNLLVYDNTAAASSSSSSPSSDLSSLSIDAKASHERLAPTNANHRFPINSARARHSVSASTTASTHTPQPPMANANDVAVWLKKDAITAINTNGKIKLGGYTSSPSFSPSPSPSLSPSPSPPPMPDDAISRKRRNTQPVSSWSYEQLKSGIDELECQLAAPDVKQRYDDFSIRLMLSKLEALRKQFQKTKKQVK